MNIETKFSIGDKVVKDGYLDNGTVEEISIEVDRYSEISITYQVHHSGSDNPHVRKDWGQSYFESELNKADGNEVKRAWSAWEAGAI